MRGEDLERRARGVGALAEPVRRALYLFVAEQPEPVSRDEAAAGVDVPRHTAKFHLDRLVADGLLQVRYQRPPGRGGPGAGRPTKRYLRADQDVAVSLPPRRYDLAGRLMAAAIDRSTAEDVPVLDALRRTAARHGRELGARATQVDPPPASPAQVVERTCAVLAEEGYEPRADGGEIVLANCPFHALAADHTSLVCGMNLALLGAMGDALAGPPAGATVAARLEPAPGRCCVVLTVT